MTTTPDAIRDLCGRVRSLARAEHDDLSIGDEAAAALEQLLEAVEDAERVIGPFAAMCDEVSSMAAQTATDPSGWSKSCSWDNLSHARAWRAKHGVQHD